MLFKNTILNILVFQFVFLVFAANGNAQVFTINPISNASVAENTDYTSVTPSITGTPIGSVTYSIAGGSDAGAFSIDETTGVVTMIARDYESPVDSNTDNIYELIIRATDSDENSDEEDWIVTVTDVQETVSLTINPISNASVAENTDYTSVTPSITGTPIGSVTYSIAGGSDAGAFSIDETTGVVTMIARDYESPVDSNTDNIYELIIRATDSDENSDEEDWIVTVTDVQETVSLTINPISNVSVAENTDYTSVTPSITGTPIGSVTYSIAGGSDAGAFSIDETTGVVTMIARDYESPVDSNTDNIYELVIRATDSDENSDEEDWSVTVTDVQETVSLTINPISNVSVAENTDYTSVTPSITGTPIGSVTYSIAGGSDAGAFSIDETTGVVTMIARDYESPADSNTDNIYELIIRATDSDENSDEEDWIVTVTDVQETVSLTINPISNASVAENTDYTSVTPSITGTPIGSVTYSIAGGSDAGAFSIDETTGVVTMIAMDYESPVDSNTDNIYELVIRATDSDENSDEEDWSVTVTDVQETVSLTINPISNVSVAENTDYTSVTPSITGTPIGSVTYSIAGGSDAGAFSIDETTGVVTMIARDYESPADSNTDNIYELIIRATDSDENSDEEDWIVTVTDVQETVSLTINPISNASVAENTDYTSVTPSITGTPIGSVTYSIAGGSDAGAFSIDETTGVVTMIARDYESPVDSNTDNIYELIIRATDSDENSDEEDWIVTVTDVQETVSLTINPISNASVAENTDYTSVTPSITGTPIGSVTYSIAGGSDAGAFSIDETTGVVTMIARDYESPVDSNTDNIYELIIRATDSDENSDEEDWIVTVTDVQETVSLTINPISNASVAENTDYTSVTPSITGTPIGSVTYSIAGGSDAGAFSIDETTGVVTMIARDYESPVDSNTDNIYELVIRATDSDENSDEEDWIVTVTDVQETVSLTINPISNASVAENTDYTSVTPSITGTPIGSVTYSIAGGSDAGAFSIDETTGVVTMIARDYESPADSNTDNIYELIIRATDSDENSDEEDWIVTVTDVQETVSLTINPISNASVAENTDYTSVTPSITGTPIGSVTYSIAGGSDAGAFSIDETTGVVTMIARDYESPVDSNTDNIYELIIRATDSDENSDEEDWIVTVTDVQETVSLTINPISNASVAENTDYTSVTPSITGTPIGSVTYSIAGGSDAGAFSIDETTGVVTMIARDYESPVDSNTDNIYELIIRATDSDENSDEEDWIVTVTDVQETVSLTINPISNASVAENTDYTSVTPSITGTPIGSVTYSIAGGSDAGAFSIDETTGVVTMIARDYESPVDSNTDNIYELIIRATDSDENSDEEDWIVTVTDVQETVSLTINPISNASVAENTDYTSVTPSITGTPIGSVTYSIAGGSDAGAFSIDETTGVVTMIARDYESPVDSNTDNIYELIIRATDSDENSDEEDWIVTVTDVQETVSLTINPISNVSVAENTDYTSVPPSITGTPIGSVTYSIAGGSDAGAFSIDETTGVVTMIARDYESPVDSNTDNIYELIIRATDSDENSDEEDWIVTVTDVQETVSLTINPISNVSVAENTDYTSVPPSITGTPIGSVTYSIAGGSDAGAFSIDETTGVVTMIARDYESPVDSNTDNIYELVIRATDSDENSDEEDWSVTVTDVQETVSLTINPISNVSVAENTDYTSVTPSITGTPIGSVTYSIAGGSDAGAFSIDETTGVVTMIARDYESPADSNTDNIYELVIRATDSDENSDEEDWSVEVLPVNDNSPILSVESTTVQENHTGVVLTATSTDADAGDSETYSISGTDASLFVIDPGSGELIFKNSPDYENPSDNGGNNVYDLNIIVTDDADHTDSESVTITVSAVNDNLPVISVGGTIIYENHTGVLLTATSTDADAGDSETYSISGTDYAVFDINSTNGELTFRSAPDFENPTDANQDNIYELTVTVTDGADHTDSESIAITVQNVEETANFSIDAISAANVSENETYTSVTPHITGSPIGDVVYTLEGTDASAFSINPSTGVVSMEARDYENPEDSNGDNVYSISITATDEDNNFVSTSWSVTIVPVNEFTPVINVGNVTLSENHLGTVTVVSSTDQDDNDTESFSITGGDFDLFSISSSNGVLTFINTPDFENPLDNDENNIYELTVVVTDGAGHSDSESITITITNLNDNTPNTNTDAISVIEGGTSTSLSGGNTSVLDNDNDADGDELTAVLISNVNYGTLTLYENGTFNYIHDGSENHSDTFTYAANDGSSNGNTVAVSITVTPVNDVPVITDIPDQIRAEDVDFSTINLDSYIEDIETLDENISWTISPVPSYFDVVINNRVASITPKDVEWNGVEVITFVATDESGASVYDNVRLEVTVVNDEPVITGQNSISIAEETLTELRLSDLIVEDPDNNYPTNYSMTILSGTNYVVTGTAITPNENVTGTITVQVYVVDPEGAQSNTYNLQVNVINDNDPPVVIDIPNQTIAEGASFSDINLNLYVSDPDHTNDQILWSYSGNSDLGITIDETTKVASVEIPNEDWYGQETIRFTASDGTLSHSNDVVLTVTAVNDAPIINSQQTLTFNEDVVFTIPFSALNVTDVDNTYSSQHEMTLLTGSNYTFSGRQVIPAQDFNGTLTIPLYISDLGPENQVSNTFNLRVAIDPVNDAPVIESQINTNSTNEDIPVEISLGDISIADVDNESTDFNLILHSGENYTFDGTIITPALNYYGTLSVGVSVSDGESINSESEVFTIAVLVLAQNDTPIANNHNVTTSENQLIAININSLISDVEDGIDLSTLKIISDVTNGTTSIDLQNAIITYVPNNGYSGADSFTYEICDHEGACASGVISILVSNEAPTGVNDIVVVDEDNSIPINVISNDTDPQDNIDTSTLTLLSLPANGEAVIQTGGIVVYTPNSNYFGEDAFEYQVCDEDGYCTSANVLITVNAINDQPVIVSQNSIEIQEEGTYTVTLNDINITDIDNNYPSDFALSVLSGNDYTVVGNTITPAINFNGDLLVNVIVNDQEQNNNVSDIYPMVISVFGVNDRPDITDQLTLSTNEDESLTVLLTDLIVEDPDNNYPNDFVLVVLAGLNYTVSNNVITPVSNYSGFLNVPVYVSDQSEENNRSRIFNLVVEVISQNDAPVSQNVNYSTSENVSVEIAFADLVTDVDGNIDYSTFENISTPINGSIQIDLTNFIVTYTPEQGFSGDDEFNFRFYDSQGLVSNISTIYININNEAPNAINDNVEINEDESIVISVLDNDTDPQDNIDINSLIIINNPVNGELTLNNTTAEITYTPNENYFGTDNFRYRVFDDLGYSDDATVSISILPINDSPIVVDDEAETNEDGSVIINVLNNDYDIDSDAELFTVSITQQPENGNATVNNLNEIEYTPNDNFNGSDVFEYQVCDAENGCNNAQVIVEILPQNDTPVAYDDEVNTSQNTEVVVNVISNDMDIDDNLDVTSLSILSQPSNGVCTVESLTGQITYVPDEDFSGSDTFTYQICDEEGLCASATVTVNVSLQNVAPVCEDDTVIMVDGETVTFSVLDNDSDVNGDAITVLIGDIDQLGGFLRVQENGVFTYTSVYGEYCIEEYFTYQGCDGSGNCDEATVKFTIGVADSDEDGIADYFEEQHFNTDGDEFPDYRDTDSDNDGILDVIEGGVSEICLQEVKDTDEDGIPDYRDEDSDDDGILDMEEGAEDCDNDGILNFQDSFDDCAERIDAPDTFSPNGDGVNDYFMIPGVSDYIGNEIFIYNRWGGEVFHMKNYDNKWDGKSSSSAIGSAELPQGLYFYVVKLGGSNGVIKGSVYIKR